MCWGFCGWFLENDQEKQPEQGQRKHHGFRNSGNVCTCVCIKVSWVLNRNVQPSSSRNLEIVFSLQSDCT